MDQSFNKFIVYGTLSIGIITFGLSPILVLFASDTSPVVLVTWRTVFAAVLLLPFWLVKRKPSQKAGASRERIRTALSGIFLGLHFTSWIASLYFTSVAAASVLVCIHPIIIILVERFLFKKGFAKTTWLGVALAFTGSALLGVFGGHFQHTHENITLGNGLAILSAFFFAAYILLGQQVRQKRGWIDYVFPVYSYAAITCILLLIIFGESPFSVSTIAILVGLGLAVGPSIIGHGAMNYAVKYLSPTLLATLFLFEPLIASVLAYFIFSELPSTFSIGAMVIVIVGIGLTWKRAIKKG